MCVPSPRIPGGLGKKDRAPTSQSMHALLPLRYYSVHRADLTSPSDVTQPI